MGKRLKKEYDIEFEGTSHQFLDTLGNMFKGSFNKNHFLSKVKSGAVFNKFQFKLNFLQENLKNARFGFFKFQKSVERYFKIAALTYDELGQIYNNIQYNYNLLRDTIDVKQNVRQEDIIESLKFYQDISNKYKIPLMHAGILAAISAKQPFNEIYFASGRATILTQGNYISAELYAGPEEVTKISDDEKLEIYKKAAIVIDKTMIKEY